MNRPISHACLLLIVFANCAYASIAQTRTITKPCAQDGPSLKDTVEYINRSMTYAGRNPNDDQGDVHIEANASQYTISFFSGREQVSSHVKYLSCETEAVVDGSGYDPPMHYASLECKMPRYPGCFRGKRWSGANHDWRDANQSDIVVYYLPGDVDERLARAFSHLVVLLQQMYQSNPATKTDPFEPK